jgi:hypothetical protein
VILLANAYNTLVHRYNKKNSAWVLLGKGVIPDLKSISYGISFQKKKKKMG